MTTVAVDIKRKTIVTDSRVSWSGGRSNTVKVHELDDGTLIAFCGNLYPAMAFIEWYKAGKVRADLPNLGEGLSFEAVVIDDTGVYTCDEHGYNAPLIDDPYFTMGSGCQFAISALLFGASLEEAVEFACEMDPASGGLVRTYVYKRKGGEKTPPSVRNTVKTVVPRISKKRKD